MTELLKDALSILKGDLSESVIQNGILSAPIEKLCEIMSFVSCEKCEPKDLVFHVRKLNEANPAWYSNVRQVIEGLKVRHDTNGTGPLMDAIDAEFPTFMVEIGKCPLHPRGGSRKGAGAMSGREHRTVLYKNVPDSIYVQIKKVVDDEVRKFVRLETVKLREERRK